MTSLLALIQIAIINALPPIQCSNNVQFEFMEGAQTLTCNQIELEERERIKFCQSHEVRENCPRSCGICCEDTTLFQFQTRHGLMKDCQWLGKQEVRSFLYCNDQDENGNSISESCPKACNVCKPFVDDNIPEYILSMTIPPVEETTSSPTLSPPPSVATCIDDQEYRYNDKISCAWIKKTEFKRQRLCANKAEVRSACPVTCGLCCTDDDSYTFLTSNSMDKKSCSFIAESQENKLKYCDRFKNGIMVKNACRQSCSHCMSRVRISDSLIDKGSGIAASQQGTDNVTLPLALGLSMSFIAIGVILGMYSIHSSMQPKMQSKRKVMDNNAMNDDMNEITMSRSTPDIGTEINIQSTEVDDSLTDEENASAIISDDASFVAPSISNLGNKNTSQTDVHKCTNFPCANCAKGQDILFLKAPRTIVERRDDGMIEFVKAADDMVCEEVTTEDILDVALSLSLSNDSSQSNGTNNERDAPNDSEFGNTTLLSETDFIS